MMSYAVFFLGCAVILNGLSIMILNRRVTELERNKNDRTNRL